VKAGIDSISFNPDALLKGIKNIKRAEEEEEAEEEPVI
jgi:pyruvate, water dikinase